MMECSSSTYSKKNTFNEGCCFLFKDVLKMIKYERSDIVKTVQDANQPYLFRKNIFVAACIGVRKAVKKSTVRLKYESHL